MVTATWIILIMAAVTRCSAYVISNEYKAKSYNYRQRFLVLHYTALDFNRSLRALTGPYVSSHYLVPEGPKQGERKIYELVPESLRAWTQGISNWGRRSNLNDQGIGVEIVNLGFRVENGSKIWYPYPKYQVDSVIDLCVDIIHRYDIEPYNVIGHSDCAPTRKTDPGPLFPWKQLYDNGIGAWPDKCDVDYFLNDLKQQSLDVKGFLKDLVKYGYYLKDVNDRQQIHSVVVAFQLHFRPSCYDGVIDIESYAILKSLLKKYF